MYGETLERLSNNFSILQKNIEEFIEAKRLAFPRLFFLNDTQFIDFLTKLKNQDDFDFYISQLFPGASGFFFKKSIQDTEIPPSIINDISALHEEEIDFSEVQEDNLKILQSSLKANLGKVLKTNHVRSYDYGNKKMVLKEVLGIISSTRELFQFEKRVTISEKPESWLQKVELSMQNTVGKNINYAVASFPKKSLDEWILDHPQQIILTTIHLILTHEINELFEEMKKTRKVHRGDDGEGESDEEEENSHLYENENTPQTPNTRDLIRNSRVSSILEDRKSSQLSHRSSLIKKMKRESKQNSLAEGHKNVEIQHKYTHDIGPGRSMNQAMNLEHPQLKTENSRDAESDASEDRRLLINNMFGSDFDIDGELLNQSSGSENDVMVTLQEKSFKGLYLRLQFWINQICKSLHGKTIDKHLELTTVHKIIMKSIV